MTPPPIAWVLNLDADLELAASAARLRGGRPWAGYRPSSAVRAAMAPHVARLASDEALRLLRPGDVLIDDASPPGCARGLVGRAFCPTARALSLLVRAGAEPEPHPTQEVLRAVNGRAFCASLGQTLPGAAFLLAVDAAIEHLARPPLLAPGRWRLKRAFGMSGRGQRVLAAGSALSEADHAFLRAAVGEGGVQIEPDVEIVRELSQHGVLAPEGSLRVGRVVEQRCDARGQWLGASLAEDIPGAARSSLAGELARVAAALHGAGYFGPFGVDAFFYRDSTPRATSFQPRSEINARFTMASALALGDRLGPGS